MSIQLYIPSYKWSKLPQTSENLDMQLGHLTSELAEVYRAKQLNEGKDRIAEELIDTIHSAYTALKILGFTDDKIKTINELVIAKNDKRGYLE